MAFAAPPGLRQETQRRRYRLRRHSPWVHNALIADGIHDLQSLTNRGGATIGSSIHPC